MAAVSTEVLAPVVRPASKLWSRVAYTALTSVCGISSFVAWDVNRKEWSDGHTWSSAIDQYFIFGTLRLVGRWQLRRLLADAERGEERQRGLLAELLGRHEHTSYGRDHGLAASMTLEDFRRVHRITRHSDYEGYFTRVADGEADVLAPGRPTKLAMTAGAASGRPRLVPHVDDVSRMFFFRGAAVAFGVIDAEFKDAVGGLQRSLRLSFRAPRRDLPCGLRVGSNAPSPEDPWIAKALSCHASPMAAYRLLDSDSLYAHALCALRDRNLGILEANFAPVLCLLMESMFDNRRNLVQDLRNGHIWDRRTLDNAPPRLLRDEIDTALGGPNPRRALEVKELLKARATSAQLWPNLKLVLATDGGSFEASGARLRELLGPGIPIYSPFYAATEGLIGVNIFPQRPFGSSAYLLDPECMFFELLPLSWRDCAEPPCTSTVLPWEATMGEAYEMIVTTRGGLCRYRLGDVVRVVARFGQMPVVIVEERSSQILPTLQGERVTEGALTKSLSSMPFARRLRGAVVVDAPGKLSAAQHHVYVEVADGDPLALADEQVLDQALCREHEAYAALRQKGTAKQLRIHSVTKGTFVALRAALASQSGSEMPALSSGQVKIPTVVRGVLAEQVMSAELGHRAA